MVVVGFVATVDFSLSFSLSALEAWRERWEGGRERGGEGSERERGEEREKEKEGEEREREKREKEKEGEEREMVKRRTT